MKYTLSSQEYNEMFRNANKTFDEEMAKRDMIINNISKKLMIMNYANEFIENRIMKYNNIANYDDKLTTFDVEAYGSYNQYGLTVHPKFKNEPIDIFNLKLTTGDTMFKNSLSCKAFFDENDPEDEGEDKPEYINMLMADNYIQKEIVFEELSTDSVKIEYKLNSKVSLGMSRFNMIEIDPYIYGAYSIKYIEIYSLNEVNGMISESPFKIINSIPNIGKVRIILDEKVKFNKVVFCFDLKEIKTQINNIDVYPFGLKHINFYEADFLEDSAVIVPIRAKDYIEYFYNDITIYHAGEPINSTCEYYDIEVYTDFINDTLVGRVYISSDAQVYRISKNTKVLYAKVPLIWKNQANTDKKYLSLSGIKFSYTVDENVFL